MRTTRSKNQKKPQRNIPKNRYLHRAKITEYRFLKVLRGFADEQTILETATTTKLSQKRVRKLYDELRGKLMRAVMLHPFEFGWAGYFLTDELAISPRGHHIFDVVAASNLLRIAINRHAPRAGFTTVPTLRFSELVFEVAVRMFCTLSMRKTNDTLYSDEIQEAYAKLQLVALYLHQQKDQPDDPEQFDTIEQSFNTIMKDFPTLLAQEEFKSLVEGYRWHKYSNALLYNDLRRYLLKNPIEAEKR